MSVTTICFIGTCLCGVVIGYSWIRYSRCLERCKRFLHIAVERSDKRLDQLNQTVQRFDTPDRPVN